MKNYTSDEIKTAKKIAFNFIFSTVPGMHLRPFKSVDLRTRIGRLAKIIVFQNRLSFQESKMLQEKRIKRRLRKKTTYTNYLQNPITIDYIKNRPTSVYCDRLVFGSRNHWAKKPQDFRILEVLQKHFCAKNH